MIVETSKEVEMSLAQVFAWKISNQKTSKFAELMDPNHFVGYTEDELNGTALDRDELEKEISGNS